MKFVKIFVILTGALIVLGVVTLFAMGRRPDAGRVDASVEIDGSPASVMPWLTESGRLKQWVGWLTEVRGDSTGEMAAGRRQVWVMNDGRSKSAIEMQVETTAWSPPDSFRVHVLVPGLVEGENHYALEDLGGRTRLTVQCRYHHPNAMVALMEPLVTPDARAKLKADLKKLSVLVASTHIEEAPPGDSLGLAPSR